MTLHTRSARARRTVAVILVLVAALTACSVPVRAPEVTAPVDPAEAERHWSNVLERFVDDKGRVDFDALATRRSDLDAFVAWVASVSPASDPQLFPSRNARIAHHLNAYNALAMYNVLEAGQPTTLAGLAKLDFFVLRKLTVGGERMSLLDYENDIIRAEGDARVHFALNCMAVSCPRLPRTPFRAASLEETLDREARRFFAESRNLRVDDQARSVTFSEILDFFSEDFLAEAPSLAAYVSRYTSRPVPEEYVVSFFDYDWTVNHTP